MMQNEDELLAMSYELQNPFAQWNTPQNSQLLTVFNLTQNISNLSLQNRKQDVFQMFKGIHKINISGAYQIKSLTLLDVIAKTIVTWWPHKKIYLKTHMSKRKRIMKYEKKRISEPGCIYKSEEYYNHPQIL